MSMSRDEELIRTSSILAGNSRLRIGLPRQQRGLTGREYVLSRNSFVSNFLYLHLYTILVSTDLLELYPSLDFKLNLRPFTLPTTTHSCRGSL